MARARYIKPGFFDNEVLGELSPLTRLLFIGLWGRADREGRLQDRPRRLKKEILGYDDVNAEDVDRMLQTLHDNDFIIRYEVEGTKYIQIANFLKHQYPSPKEAASETPPPSGWTPPKKVKKSAADDADESTDGDETDYIPEPNKDEASSVPAQPLTVNGLPGTVNCSLSTVIPSPGGGGGEQKNALEQRFAAFWAEYPRQTGETPALKIWKHLKPDKELFDKIMAGLGKAKKSHQWTKDHGEFIPEAVNWLKEKRWTDNYKGGTPNGGSKPAVAGAGGGKSGFTPAAVGP